MKTMFITFLPWLLHASWQGAVLTVVVLATQRVFREKLDAQWRYALWLLVLARLVLPCRLPSPVSLFNYASAERGATAVMNQFFQGEYSGSTPNSSSAFDPGWSLVRTENALEVGGLVWLGGALLFAVRIFAPYIVFRRRLGRARRRGAEATHGLCRSCTAEMGMTSEIHLTETSLVRSPAVVGMLRPIILLPSDIISRFDARELRHIFLHELAHVKRRDTIVLWVVTVLRILHWFNPLLGYGFRRMAADRELACDELVLHRVGEGECASYGKTILKLVELCKGPATAPGIVGVMEERGQMRRRITMIANFKPGRHWSGKACALLLAMSLVTLTDAQQTNPKQKDQIDLSLPAPHKQGSNDSRTNKPKLKITQVAVEGTGIISVNGKEVPAGKLKETLQSLRTADPDLAVVVKASDDALYRDVAKVLDVLQQLNISKVGLATQPTPSGR